MNYLLTKNRYLHFLSAMLFLFVSSNAQKVQASFKENAGQLIKIGVFNGFQSKNIDSLYADAKGNVSFKINIDNPGIGYLITEIGRAHV
jgi:hypothetical protein